jgi:hypothetical protein
MRVDEERWQVDVEVSVERRLGKERLEDGGADTCW